MRPVAEVVSEYDDNVYLLADANQPDVADPSGSAVMAGRYAGMASAGDLITTLSGAAQVEGTGAFGRDLTIRPEVAYAAYARNAERRNVALGLSVAQQLAHGSRVRLMASATPSYFARNYLADAVDVDGDGSIGSAERRYAPGTYREHQVGLDYRRRLDKSTKRSPRGAAVELGAGYYGRAHEAPFRGRDVSGPTGEAALLLDLTRRASLDVRYRFAALSGAPAPQVMLIDEADVGQDLNGNGSFADGNVRVEASTDRSRTEHSAGARVAMELTKRVHARLSAERRWRAFGSEEPLDLSNNGRRDERDELGGELSMRVMSGVRLVGGGSYAVQRVRRGADAGVNEIDDYDRLRLSLGVRYSP